MTRDEMIAEATRRAMAIPGWRDIATGDKGIPGCTCSRCQANRLNFATFQSIVIKEIEKLASEAA